MEISSSPYKKAQDSPSRQLLWELGHLSIKSQENFNDRLDRVNSDREAAHTLALAAAAAEHERVRKSAETQCEILRLRIENERKAREQEEQKQLELKRQEKTEKEIAERRREIEQARIAAIEQKRLDEARKAATAAVEKRKVEKERQEAEAKAEATKLLREKQEAEQKKQTPPPKPAAAPSPSRAIPAREPSRSDPQNEAEHQRYLEIHQRLKDLRTNMKEQAKQNEALKIQMGDMRREIKKCVGQLIGDKKKDKEPHAQLLKVLRTAASVPEPKVEIPMFLASPPPIQGSTMGPALLVYELNIFAKAIISQFIDEAGVSPKAADPVGLIASQIFTDAAFRWNGLSLIDILMAKFHAVCPVLWGIYGDEKTVEGKTRLGWWREEKGGPWISAQRHNERMTGLGAGFAAIALRNYNKSRQENPYPNENYWHSLACIVNVPANQVTQTHFLVLKAMIENNAGRFLLLFGDAGRWALRRALVDFPQQAAQQSVAAKAVAGLWDVLRRDQKIFM